MRFDFQIQGAGFQLAVLFDTVDRFDTCLNLLENHPTSTDQFDSRTVRLQRLVQAELTGFEARHASVQLLELRFEVQSITADIRFFVLAFRPGHD